MKRQDEFPKDGLSSNTKSVLSDFWLRLGQLGWLPESPIVLQNLVSLERISQISPPLLVDNDTNQLDSDLELFA